MSNFKPDPDYELMMPVPVKAKRGSQCGECGMKFEFGQSYGFSCGNQRCPMQLKPTFSNTTTTLC